MFNEKLKIDFAVRIHQIGVFKDKTRSPQGQGFKLKLHELNPDAPLSPFYLDFRLLQSDYDAKRMAVSFFGQQTNELPAYPDLLAAIPEAIVPVVSSLSDMMHLPMITPRLAKGHGSGAKVDGIFKPGQTAALFDDVVTGADSKLGAASTLRAVGIEVAHVFVLVDRQQAGGEQQLQQAGLALHSVFLLDELLEIYRQRETVTPAIYQEIQAYRESAK